MLDLSAVFARFPTLETERYLLREVTPDDAADIFQMMSDPQVTRYLGYPPMGTMDEAVQRVQMLQRTFREESGIPWAITPRARGQVIGTCVYWNLVPAHFRAEIGFVLAPEWWGQGVMREAATAVLDYGFTQMGLHSVEAQTTPENAESQGLLKRLGFEQEGYFRENYYDSVADRFEDTTVFSLLKTAWMDRAEL